MAPKIVFSLDDLLNETAGYVSIAGTEHAVLAVNAAEYQRIVAHDWSSGDLQPVMDVIARVMPTLGTDGRQRLTLKAVTKIAQIAMNIAETVERDVLPNSSGPVTTNQSPAESVASPAG